MKTDKHQGQEATSWSSPKQRPAMGWLKPRAARARLVLPSENLYLIWVGSPLVTRPPFSHL